MKKASMVTRRATRRAYQTARKTSKLGSSEMMTHMVEVGRKRK